VLEASGCYAPKVATGVPCPGAPRFADADYHISAQSDARNQAAAGASLPADIDGEARPLGTDADLGADEIP